MTPTPPVSSDPSRALAFLAEASRMLAGSIDYETTLATVTRLCVPALVDWCEIIMLENDELRRVVVYNVDPAKTALANEMLRRYPYRRTGSEISQRATLVPHVTEEVLSAITQTPEMYGWVRGLGLQSLMVVPLVAGGKMLGILSCATAESGRVLTNADLTLAEDLASRVAMAVSTAQLYRAERRARAQAEQALAAHRATEEMLQALLDASTAVVYVFDTELRYRLVNRRHQELFGAGPRIGHSTFEVFPRDIAERLAQNTRQVMETGQPSEFEEEVQQADGLHTYLSVKVPLRDVTGVVRGVCGISTDITERKRALEELRRSEERFSKVFRTSPVSITITRLSDGTFVDVNDACERLTGYARADMLGKTGIQLGLWINSADRVSLMDELRKTNTVREREAKLRRRGGEIRDVLMSLDLCELGGEPCILALAQDITEHKRLEQRLLQSQKMEAIGRLAGGVAHDFNNILTTITGYSDVVMAGIPADSPLRSSAEHIQRSAARASALVRQLLVFARKQIASPVVLDLGVVIAGMENLLRRLVREDIELGVELAAGVPQVEADPAQLEQILLNLVLNARDAILGGGRIVIATAAVAGGVLLRVADTGVGMDEATRARIFEPFFTTKEPGKGTGLGLSTVYSIVEQCGGHISVESTLGKGSTFDIVLPAAQGVAAPAPSPHPAAPTAKGTETILVVEDDADVREFLGTALGSAGYRVLAAHDGATALQMAAEHRGPIAALVCDLVMPLLNGRQVAEQLGPLRPEMRVLLISGYPGDTLERYGQLPQAAFLEKPFKAQELLRKLRSLLDE
jgi:PAS domain S-box-containing protein